MREAVFSSLGPRLAGARCLDLFAGTGAYGLEALSRLAGHIVWVEKNRECIQFIEKNRENTLRSLEGSGQPAAGQTRIHHQSVYAFLEQTSPEPFDLIFADPPYSWLEPEVPTFFEKVEPWLSVPGGQLILESSGQVDIQVPGWVSKRGFGKGRGRGPLVRIFERA